MHCRLTNTLKLVGWTHPVSDTLIDSLETKLEALERTQGGTGVAAGHGADNLLALFNSQTATPAFAPDDNVFGGEYASFWSGLLDHTLYSGSEQHSLWPTGST